MLMRMRVGISNKKRGNLTLKNRSKLTMRTVPLILGMTTGKTDDHWGSRLPLLGNKLTALEEIGAGAEVGAPVISPNIYRRISKRQQDRKNLFQHAPQYPRIELLNETTLPISWVRQIRVSAIRDVT